MNLRQRQRNAKFLFGNRAHSRISNLDAVLRSLTVSELGAGTKYAPWLCQSIQFSLVDADRFLTDKGSLELISRRYSSEHHDGDLSVFGLQETGFRLNISFNADQNAKQTFAEAFDLIERAEWLGSTFDSVVQHVIPIYSVRTDVRQEGIGFSSALARNAIFLSCPSIPEFAALELAVNMAHELGHQILHIYQACDPLFESDSFAPIYSGIRKMDRPAILSLHAAVALGFMINAFEAFAENTTDVKQATYSKHRVGELRSDLVHTLVSLRKAKMTTLGCELTQELAMCCG